MLFSGRPRVIAGPAFLHRQGRTEDGGEPPDRSGLQQSISAEQ